MDKQQINEEAHKKARLQFDPKFSKDAYSACVICFTQGVEYAVISSQSKQAEAISFGRWVSHNDWVYLPSKQAWVNEEQEELAQSLTDTDIYQLYLQSLNK